MWRSEQSMLRHQNPRIWVIFNLREIQSKSSETRTLLPINRTVNSKVQSRWDWSSIPKSTRKAISTSGSAHTWSAGVRSRLAQKAKTAVVYACGWKDRRSGSKSISADTSIDSSVKGPASILQINLRISTSSNTYINVYELADVSENSQMSTSYKTSDKHKKWYSKAF